MTKRYKGKLYDTHPDWYPVVVNKQTTSSGTINQRAWLYEKCPNGSEDYDAYGYDEVSKVWESKQTIFFFRDPKIAVEFTLRWS